MRKLLWTLPVLALGLVALTPTDVHGFGKRKGGGGGDCDYGYGASYGPAPAPTCVVGYVDKVVTSYQPRHIEEEVEVTVMQPVYSQRTEKYTYTENERVETPTKHTVRYYEQVMVDQPVSYQVCKTVTEPTKVTVRKWVNVPTRQTVEVASWKTVTTPQKHTVRYNEMVETEEDTTWTEYKTVTTPQKQTVTSWTCQPQEVISNVPVTRCVPCTIVDSCGNCQTVMKPVCELQTVRHTVMRQVPVQSEIVVNVTQTVPTEVKGKRKVGRWVERTREETVNVTSCQLVKENVEVTVNRLQEQTEEVTVNVTRNVWVTENSTVKVCQLQERTREETVNVVSYRPVQKEGARTYTVCDMQPTKTRVRQSRCVMEPVQTVVKCPIYGPVGCDH